MNTFKTTACAVLLMTAGFAMENGDTPPHTPVHTPVQQAFGGLHIGTPHGILPQQLFANTPEHVQQQHGFVTPQDQGIQHVIPGAPVAGRLRFNPVTPDDFDRLVGSVTSSPVVTNKKRNHDVTFGDVTVLDPKGKVLLTTGKKKNYQNSRSARKCASPTDVASGITRLESDMYTPAVHPSMLQFTTDKNIGSRTWVNPILEDVDNEYLTDDDNVVGADDANAAVHDISGSFVLHGAGLLNAGNVAQDDSMGSFVIHGAALLDNSADHSVLDDSSFHIHGAGLLNAEDDEHQDDESVEDADDSLNMSVISYDGSDVGADLDMSDDELDLSDEE